MPVFDGDGPTQRIPDDQGIVAELQLTDVFGGRELGQKSYGHQFSGDPFRLQSALNREGIFSRQAFDQNAKSVSGQVRGVRGSQAANRGEGPAEPVDRWDLQTFL